jgi:hypothetical protein
MNISPFTLIYRNDNEPVKSAAGIAQASKRKKRSTEPARDGRLQKIRIGLPPLVRREREQAGEKSFSTGTQEPQVPAGSAAAYLTQLQEVRKVAPKLAEQLESFQPNLMRTLLISSFAQQAIPIDAKKAVQKLKPILADLKRSEEVLTVAVWDLGAQPGGLSDIISRLNQAQRVFTLFELQAPIPAGLVIQPDYFAYWGRVRMRRRFSKKVLQEIKQNMMFDDFLKHAQRVHQTVGVDYLIGITPYMIAFTEKGELKWNYFATCKKKIVLASTHDLRRYAREASRSFPAVAIGVGLSQLLVAMNKRLHFHENRGCIFDFNQERETIVDSIKKAQIEPDCLKLIKAKYRDATLTMLEVLVSYSEGPGQEAPSQEEAENADASYWLEQLNKLGAKANE